MTLFSTIKQMLEGTELNFAYTPLTAAAHNSNSNDDMYSELAAAAQASAAPPPPSSREEKKSTSIPLQVPKSQIQPQMQTQPMQPSQLVYDPGMFARPSYDHDQQKMIAVINEYKKRQATMRPNEESYWDKLANKKKEVYKFLQSALIIMFALSVHFLISHYFSIYLENNDLSYERELMLRVLYPAAILFFAWNIIAFIK
jgi:hypothetical protein